MRGTRWVAGALFVLAAVEAGYSDGSDGGGGAKDTSFGSDVVKDVEVASQGGDYRGSIDAALTADGKTVYFTATGSNGPGVFRLPASGGRAEPVAVGGPFQKPVGVAVSTDGSRVFVADAETGGRGAVLAVPTTGTGVTQVQGTINTAPRGIEIARDGNQDTLYFTGKDARDGTPGVYQLPAVGASSSTTVLKGAPLVDPDAVTATRAGVVFVPTGPARSTASPMVRPSGSRTYVRPGLLAWRSRSTSPRCLVSVLSDDGTDRVEVIASRR